jgi:hypothetical protein
MYNSDTELIFPLRVVPALDAMRSDNWQNLVRRISDENADRTEQATFVLMMARLGGCAGCNADSFRAMRGCTQCARQTIKRYRGNDADLMELFGQTKIEVENFIKKTSENTGKAD